MIRHRGHRREPDTAGNGAGSACVPSAHTRRVAAVTELSLADTTGMLQQPEVRVRRTSAGLGWEQLYLSAQKEQPYRAEFAPAATHALVLHLDGPVTVSRRSGRF